ncbi:VanZ family protein [uncultured Eubacterium sp.]|uniref:VanZ family protein n=1 Tax=uncultured Eubacterium sp. TaxID=165185 RepID=UPI0025F6B6B2|nr:VanZ family protein [uncultured Eubacterium sp.]
MDIYQILITYNPMWSWREILCFGVVAALTLFVLIRAVRHGRVQIVQAIALMMFLTFLAIVFESTVFTRTTITRQAEWIPFWSWHAIIRYHDMELLKEDLLNCLLLFPAGVLLPFIVNQRIRPKVAFFVGFLISLGIESCQLIFARGLFEWDDMIHNALGCMFGCILVDVLWRCYKKVKFGKK